MYEWSKYKQHPRAHGLHAEGKEKYKESGTKVGWKLGTTYFLRGKGGACRDQNAQVTTGKTRTS